MENYLVEQNIPFVYDHQSYKKPGFDCIYFLLWEAWTEERYSALRFYSLFSLIAILFRLVISVSFFSFLPLVSSGISISGKLPYCLGAFPGPHDVLSMVLSQCLTFWWHLVVSSTKLTFTQGQGGTNLTLVPSTMLMPIFMYILPFLQNPVKCKYWRLTFLVEKRFLDRVVSIKAKKM